MTFIDTVSDLLIAVNEPKDRDRTMPKRDRNHKCLPPRNQIRLINEQIHISTRIPRKPSQNRCEPGCLQGIHRQGCVKKAEKSFLFRLLPGNNKRQTRGDLIDAKGFRNTDRYQDEQQVPKSRFFQTGCVKFLSQSLCGILSLLIPEGIPSPAFQ